jgi:hypothetical protein
MQAYKRSRRISPLILNLGTKVRCDQIHELPPLLTLGKEDLYQFNGRLGGPQGQSIRF